MKCEKCGTEKDVSWWWMDKHLCPECYANWLIMDANKESKKEWHKNSSIYNI